MLSYIDRFLSLLLFHIGDICKFCDMTTSWAVFMFNLNQIKSTLNHDEKQRRLACYYYDKSSHGTTPETYFVPYTMTRQKLH